MKWFTHVSNPHTNHSVIENKGAKLPDGSFTVIPIRGTVYTNDLGFCADVHSLKCEL